VWPREVAVWCSLLVPREDGEALVEEVLPMISYSDDR
jgi:hypothetical protein